MIKTSEFHVAASNVEQARAWDGDEGAYWAAHAERFEESIARHHRHLLAAIDRANLPPDARVLDVGCGTGRSTLDLAERAPDGFALGIDLSSRMLDVARHAARRAGISNVTFERADAQVRRFASQSFDAVVSRTAAMFFGDKPAAFANLAAALRPGGLLALLVWHRADMNEWFTAFTHALAAGRALPAPPPGGPHPFSLSDPTDICTLLEGAGFAAVTTTEVRAPMYFGADRADAYRFVLGLLSWMLDGLAPAQRAAALGALRTTVAEHCTEHGVTYGAATWVVTAQRR